MNKTNKILAVALVAQVVLLVAVSFAKDDMKIAPLGRVFETLVADKVTRIEVTGNSGTKDEPKLKTVVLEKSGDKWGVAGAENYPADATKISEFLKNVEKLKTSGPVVSKEAYFKKLEVAEDEFQRKITLTQDGQPITFFLGSSPGPKRVHLRKDGSKDVVLTEGLTVWEVGHRAADWVDKAYFKVPESDVWALSVKNEKGTIQLEKSPSGEWAMLGLKPDQKLKKSAVDDLVRKASSITLDEPLGKAMKAEYALDKPLATITLVAGTSTIAGQPPPSTTTHTVFIGAKTPENQYYVDSSTSDYVVTAASWAVESLTTKTASDLIDVPAPPAPAPKK